VQRNKEKFERAVKVELQSISATYQKEIETLRMRLGEADSQLNVNNRNKHMMQENLKKVFMRSVCALNFEAMTILDPAE
jgi:Rps23 Pro-64 3,4-dihydroxylase Tpa1-like proline 4-hydroxylase